MAIKILSSKTSRYRKTLQYNLAKESYDVATAGSISEAKSLTNQNQPHLIILDLMLPDGSGLDFVGTLNPGRY